MIPSDWGVRMGEEPGGAAPCHGLGEIFFSDDPGDVEHAKAVCASCLRAASCLGGALERGEACGVWGGELVRLGAVLDVVPRRGRPRKAA